MNLFAMSYQRHRNTEEDFNPRFKFSTEEKIKVFGKSAVAIHSLILRSTEVCRSVRLRARLKHDTFARGDISVT